MKFDLDERQREFQQAASEYLEANARSPAHLLRMTAAPRIDGVWRGLMELGVGRLDRLRKPTAAWVSDCSISQW